MKTRLQHFDTLKPRIRYKALKNTLNALKSRGDISYDGFLNLKNDCIIDCIKKSFNFYESFEGYRFWESVIRDIKIDILYNELMNKKS